MNLKLLTEKVDAVSINYTTKFDINRDSDWFVLKLQEELGELIQSYLMLIGQARAKGKTEEEIKSDFESELADVFCHVLLLSKHYVIDIEKVVHEKWLKFLE